MYKKLLCWMMAFVFVLASGGDKLILSVGADLIPDAGLEGSETITMMRDFTDDIVLVVLTHEASLEFIDYTPADFPELECSEIRDLSTGTGTKVQALLRGEQLEANSIGERFMNQNIEIDGFNRIISLKLTNPSKGNVLRAVAALEQREDVESAEPNYISQVIEPQGVVLPEELPPYGWAATKIQQEDAWEIETGSNSIAVGILDSGVDITHPELSGRVDSVLSEDFVGDGVGATEDPNGHGTQVAGIIGARCNNDALNFCGVCQNVKLVSLRVSYGTGYMSNANFIEAVNYAKLKNIPILNVSATLENAPDNALLKAINNYKGLMIWAAGNSNINYDDDDRVPPGYWDYEHIIVVGGSTSTDTRYSSSNYGNSTIDLFAPGANVASCFPVSRCEDNDCTSTTHLRDGYHTNFGTSFAAPFVTGVAALIFASHPNATRENVKTAILYSVDAVSAFRNICVSGGRLNAYKALTNKTIHNDVAYTSINGAYHRVSCNDCDATWQEAHTERPGVEVCVHCQEYLW